MSQCEPNHLLDARRLAPLFRVTAPTVLAWARRGWVPCLRGGRAVLFDPKQVEDALRARGRWGWQPAWSPTSPTPAEGAKRSS